jgi:DNA/RNA-binding domain of Phe-tRNA-synthetase-like protein
MPDRVRAEAVLAEARVDRAVFDLRPDYRAVLMIVDGIEARADGRDSESDLQSAEAAARRLLHDTDLEEIPHVAAWREAYRAFGAKPQRTRNSLEALLRRAEAGLPRVNRLTDAYNAISVLHRIPVGGEDLLRYAGAPRLVRASGFERFDTTADGAAVVEHPEPGEVVWCDDEGVTCRRWNWRQARRTQLTDDTTAALFILDALDPVADDDVLAAADQLAAQLAEFGADVQVARRIITAL